MNANHEREHELFKRALQLYEEKKFAEALAVALASVARGDVESHMVIALIYERGGDGVVQDDRAALAHYRIAFEQGQYLAAGLGVARIRSRGHADVLDFREAIAILQEIVSENGDPIAMINLGRLLTHGLGCEPDYERARALFERAIEAGYVFGHTYLADLEWKQGRVWQSIKQRFFAARLMLRLSRLNPRDRRTSRI